MALKAATVEGRSYNMIHDLKCWPEYFQAVKSGVKPFELRKEDRGYVVGDILHLREFDPEKEQYTGDEIDKTVTYVLPTKLFGAIGEGAKYVIMGLSPRPDWTPCAEGLPEEDGEFDVTVCVIENHVKKYYSTTATFDPFDDEDCWCQNEHCDGAVVAWKKLSDPYNPDQFREPTEMIQEETNA